MNFVINRKFHFALSQFPSYKTQKSFYFYFLKKTIKKKSYLIQFQSTKKIMKKYPKKSFFRKQLFYLFEAHKPKNKLEL